MKKLYTGYAKPLSHRKSPYTYEEPQAICLYGGQYLEEKCNVTYPEILLTCLLKCADNLSGGVLEERLSLNREKAKIFEQN